MVRERLGSPEVDQRLQSTGLETPSMHFVSRSTDPCPVHTSFQLQVNLMSSCYVGIFFCFLIRMVQNDAVNLG